MAVGGMSTFLVVLLVTACAAPVLGTDSTKTNVACSAGFVGVKFGKGIICVAGDGGSNVFSGNQVGSGNAVGKNASGSATAVTSAGDGGSITGRHLLGKQTTNIACSAGLVAVKWYGQGIVCVAGAGGSNIASGNQIGSGNAVGKNADGSATAVTTAGDGGSITGRRLLGKTTTNIACSAGLVAVKAGPGIFCVAGNGGSNIASGNQVLSGNAVGKNADGSAVAFTTAGDGGSITG